MRNWIYDHKVAIAVPPTAAGTTDVNGNAIDTQGFQGIAFEVGIGTLTATQVTKLKAQYSDDGSTNWLDVAGSLTAAAADSQGSKVMRLSIYKPRKRYVRVVVDRGTANAVVDLGLAFLFLAQRTPITQGSGVATDGTNAIAKALNEPDTGTA